MAESWSARNHRQIEELAMTDSGRDRARVHVEAEPAPRRTQRERTEMSTRSLLNAFASLIAERGYERTTLVDIGKRSGYSHGLVTRRFGSKAGLLVALVEHMSTRFGHQHVLDLVGDRVGVEALQHIAREIASDVRRSPEDLRAFYVLIFEALKPIPELQQPMQELGREYRVNIVQLIAAGLDAGRLRPGTDPVVLADLFVDAVRGASYHWVLDPDEVDLVARLEALARHLGEVYGVGTP
jgi:AcrR family transcriptional regulator